MAFRYGGAHSMGGVLSVNIFTGEQKALVYFDESTGFYFYSSFVCLFFL